MADVTGATALELAPVGSDDLVAQLNEAAAVRCWWPALLLVPIIGWIAAPWVRLKQHARRSVVVFYQVEDDHDAAFARLAESWATFGRSAAVWRVITAGNVRTTQQYKTNSGASSLVSRIPVAVTLSGPDNLVTNIQVPSIMAKDHALHFLPDRLLVRSGRRFSDVSYERLKLSAQATRFIESGTVPRDSTQVDTTWQYVNVKGGPDKRYKNNRQLPVLQYAELDFATADGLNWVVQGSNLQAADMAAGAAAQMKAVSRAG